MIRFVDKEKAIPAAQAVVRRALAQHRDDQEKKTLETGLAKKAKVKAK